MNTEPCKTWRWSLVWGRKGLLHAEKFYMDEEASFGPLGTWCGQAKQVKI
jgi:hypothetical protein